MNNNSQGFNENYKKLKEISDDLSRQSQGEPDIDGLLPKVEEATKAYKACKERLDAVEKALAEQLPNSDCVPIDSSEKVGTSKKSEHTTTDDNSYDDIPF